MSDKAKDQTLLAMDPQQRAVAEEFDQYSESYTDAVNKSLSFSGTKVDAFVEAKAVDLLNFIEQNFGDPSRQDVLDVGCGVGNYHPFLMGKVGSLTGIDVSAECVAQAKQAHPGVNYDIYEGSTLPYEDNSFSVAYCICVMHHVPPAAWPAFSKELVRVVKPGGAIVVYEHNPWHPLTRKVVSDCPFDRDAVLIPMPKMRTLLKDAGAASVKTRSILTVPPLGKLAYKLDGAFVRLPFGTQYRAVATVS